MRALISVNPIPETKARPRSMRLAAIGLAAIALVTLAALSPVRARAEGNPDWANIPQSWSDALGAYVNDPVNNRAGVFMVEREAIANGTLTPPLALLIADAYIRSGRPRTAEKYLQDALDARPGYPWDDFANLGMGGTHMMTGDPVGAQAYFNQVANSPESSSRALGNLGLGHSLAASGRPMDAKAAFDAVAANESVEGPVRQAGAFGAASALYAAGDYDGAARAYDAIAAADPDGKLGGDARYAAARARLAKGDREDAITGLKATVAACDRDQKTAKRHAPRALRNLDARALNRAWLRHYQTTAWSEVMGKATPMFSIGGCDLARSTLRQLKAEENGAVVVQEVSVTETQPAANVAKHTEQARPAPAAPAPSRETAAKEAGHGLLLAIAGIVVALAAFLWWRRTRAA